MGEYYTKSMEIENTAAFVDAAADASNAVPHGHKIEFVCPCCGETAYIARSIELGDEYAWCDCGMRYYRQGFGGDLNEGAN